MPFDMRWFQIFYTTLGTAFMGAVFGEAANLRNDINDLSKLYAWKRQETSKRMVKDMQGPDGDDRVDQYEFLVGSLLLLNKLDRSDIEQIMDKFRELAGDKGFIMHEDVTDLDGLSEVAEMEGLVIEEEVEKEEVAQV